jgi:hypothetical protein
MYQSDMQQWVPPRELAEVGDTVRLAYTCEWIGKVIDIEGDDAWVSGRNGVTKHRLTLLFTTPQTTTYD